MNGLVLQPILSLCSGAGGLDLGVHDALGGRARTVCYVEHETTACEVLATRIADGALDDAPIWTDLHAFDGRPWRGKVAGIIGGYPCQPFSVAGKRLGVNDPRHLWPSIERIIGEVEPGWCFFENVGGHLRLGYWDVVRPGIERLGYRVAQGLFTAAEVGAPHQRERLFILAHRTGGHAGYATEWEGREDSSGGGGDLEYTARSQRSQRSGSAGGAGGGADSERWAASRSGAGDSDVADATLGGQRERGESPRGHGQSDGDNGEVADPGSGQLPEPGRGQEGRDGAGPAGARVLGDACGTLGEGRVFGGGAYAAGREEQDGHPGQPGDLLPAFPPGPGDATTWLRILRDHPDLAPAVEPALRGLANGLEPRMDLTRTAQLRITGNGVVPQCASLAFRTLWGSLADPGHAERTERAHEG